jgi:hypothetical protein
MANVKHEHVWIIDTAADDISLEDEMVRTIRWVGTAGGAGGAEIEDRRDPAAPVVVWAARTGAGELSQESNPFDLRLRNGFNVPTLLAGTVLYIYLSHAGFR